jgi:flagellar motor switch protein FliN/FliY
VSEANTSPDARSVEPAAAVPIESVSPLLASEQLNLILDVELALTLRFGTKSLLLQDILQLNAGSVVELDRQVQDPVELLLDGRLIARGEVVVVDGNYGLRVQEVFSPSSTI